MEICKHRRDIAFDLGCKCPSAKGNTYDPCGNMEICKHRRDIAFDLGCKCPSAKGNTKDRTAHPPPTATSGSMMNDILKCNDQIGSETVCNFKILNIPGNSSNVMKDGTKNYRKQAMKFHPDK